MTGRGGIQEGGGMLYNLRRIGYCMSTVMEESFIKETRKERKSEGLEA